MTESPTFTCTICERTFMKDRSDAEALAEMRLEFPAVPDEQCGMVCGDCHIKIQAWLTTRMTRQ